MEKLKIGNTIKKLRTGKNLTLTELSRRSGIHLATLSRMENNKTTGSMESHSELAYVLGLKLSEFIQECEKDQLESDEIELMEVFVGAN